MWNQFHNNVTQKTTIDGILMSHWCWITAIFKMMCIVLNNRVMSYYFYMGIFSKCLHMPAIPHASTCLMACTQSCCWMSNIWWKTISGIIWTCLSAYCIHLLTTPLLCMLFAKYYIILGLFVGVPMYHCPIIVTRIWNACHMYSNTQCCSIDQYYTIQLHTI